MTLPKKTPKSAKERMAEYHDRLKVPYNYKRPIGISPQLIKEVVAKVNGRKGGEEKVMALLTKLVDSSYSQHMQHAPGNFGEHYVQVHHTHLRHIFDSESDAYVAAMEEFGLIEKLRIDPETGEIKEKGFYKPGTAWRKGLAHQFRIAPACFKPVDGKYFKTYQLRVSKSKADKWNKILKRLPKNGLDESRELVRQNILRLVLLDNKESRDYLLEEFAKRNLSRDLEKWIADYNDITQRIIIMDAFGHRLHSLLIQAAKRLRAEFRFEGALAIALAELDICASQPSMFACMTPELLQEYVSECVALSPQLADFFTKAMATEDYQLFQRLCDTPPAKKGEPGQGFYEYLVQEWNARYPEDQRKRDGVKGVYNRAVYSSHQRVRRRNLEELIERVDNLQDALVGIENPTKAQKKALKKAVSQLETLRCYQLFQQIFPSLMKLMGQIQRLDWSSINPKKKKTDKGSRRHTNTSLLAQRFESALVFRELVPALVKVGIKDFYTIHDSFRVKETEYDLARTAVETRLRELGLPLHLKLKE